MENEIYNKKTKLISTFLFAILLTSSFNSFSEDSFESLINEFSNNPQLLEDSWTFRDRKTINTKAMGKGAKSERAISEKAKNMIVNLEIGSEALYKQRYENPIWPESGSGITIGIGYDLGYADKAYLHRDWDNLIASNEIDVLEGVLGKKGLDAKNALPSVKDGVKVTWEAASAQFKEFLPYVVSQTEKTFRHTDKLNDHCMGALVSLVYNRGTDLSSNKDKRREMRAIYDLMKAKKFSEIPKNIRSMKRLWEGSPKAQGLVKRRELEARLFEIGLSEQAVN